MASLTRFSGDYCDWWYERSSPPAVSATTTVVDGMLLGARRRMWSEPTILCVWRDLTYVRGDTALRDATPFFIGTLPITVDMDNSTAQGSSGGGGGGGTNATTSTVSIDASWCANRTLWTSMIIDSRNTTAVLRSLQQASPVMGFTTYEQVGSILETWVLPIAQLTALILCPQWTLTVSSGWLVAFLFRALRLTGSKLGLPLPVHADISNTTAATIDTEEGTSSSSSIPLTLVDGASLDERDEALFLDTSSLTLVNAAVMLPQVSPPEPQWLHVATTMGDGAVPSWPLSKLFSSGDPNGDRWWPLGPQWLGFTGLESQKMNVIVGGPTNRSFSSSSSGSSSRWTPPSLPSQLPSSSFQDSPQTESPGAISRCTSALVVTALLLALMPILSPLVTTVSRMVGAWISTNRFKVVHAVRGRRGVEAREEKDAAMVHRGDAILSHIPEEGTRLGTLWTVGVGVGRMLSTALRHLWVGLGLMWWLPQLGSLCIEVLSACVNMLPLLYGLPPGIQQTIAAVLRLPAGHAENVKVTWNDCSARWVGGAWMPIVETRSMYALRHNVTAGLPSPTSNASYQSGSLAPPWLLQKSQFQAALVASSTLLTCILVLLVATFVLVLRADPFRLSILHCCRCGMPKILELWTNPVLPPLPPEPVPPKEMTAVVPGNGDEIPSSPQTGNLTTTDDVVAASPPRVLPVVPTTVGSLKKATTKQGGTKTRSMKRKISKRDSDDSTTEDESTETSSSSSSYSSSSTSSPDSDRARPPPEARAQIVGHRRIFAAPGQHVVQQNSDASAVRRANTAVVRSVQGKQQENYHPGLREQNNTSRIITRTSSTTSSSSSGSSSVTKPKSSRRSRAADPPRRTQLSRSSSSGSSSITKPKNSGRNRAADPPRRPQRSRSSSGNSSAYDDREAFQLEGALRATTDRQRALSSIKKDWESRRRVRDATMLRTREAEDAEALQWHTLRKARENKDKQLKNPLLALKEMQLKDRGSGGAWSSGSEDAKAERKRKVEVYIEGDGVESSSSSEEVWEGGGGEIERRHALLQLDSSAPQDASLPSGDKTLDDDMELPPILRAMLPSQLRLHKGAVVPLPKEDSVVAVHSQGGAGYHRCRKPTAWWRMLTLLHLTDHGKTELLEAPSDQRTPYWAFFTSGLQALHKPMWEGMWFAVTDDPDINTGEERYRNVNGAVAHVGDDEDDSGGESKKMGKRPTDGRDDAKEGPLEKSGEERPEGWLPPVPPPVKQRHEKQHALSKQSYVWTLTFGFWYPMALALFLPIALVMPTWWQHPTVRGLTSNAADTMWGSWVPTTILTTTTAPRTSFSTVLGDTTDINATTTTTTTLPPELALLAPAQGDTPFVQAVKKAYATMSQFVTLLISTWLAVCFHVVMGLVLWLWKHPLRRSVEVAALWVVYALVGTMIPLLSLGVMMAQLSPIYFAPVPFTLAADSAMLPTGNAGGASPTPTPGVNGTGNITTLAPAAVKHSIAWWVASLTNTTQVSASALSYLPLTLSPTLKPLRLNGLTDAFFLWFPIMAVLVVALTAVGYRLLQLIGYLRSACGVCSSLPSVPWMPSSRRLTTVSVGMTSLRGEGVRYKGYDRWRAQRAQRVKEYEARLLLKRSPSPTSRDGGSPVVDTDARGGVPLSPAAVEKTTMGKDLGAGGQIGYTYVPLTEGELQRLARIGPIKTVVKTGGVLTLPENTSLAVAGAPPTTAAATAGSTPVRNPLEGPPKPPPPLVQPKRRLAPSKVVL